jgi:hypothetical protein
VVNYYIIWTGVSSCKLRTNGRTTPLYPFSGHILSVCIVNSNLIMYCRTKAGMTSAAESITESLRRSRQLMVQVSTLIMDSVEVNDFLLLSSKVNYCWQEVERSANTLSTFGMFS